MEYCPKCNSPLEKQIESAGTDLIASLAFGIAAFVGIFPRHADKETAVYRCQKCDYEGRSGI